MDPDEFLSKVEIVQTPEIGIKDLIVVQADPDFGS
jgi:hypothetical protein